MHLRPFPRLYLTVHTTVNWLALVSAHVNSYCHMTISVYFAVGTHAMKDPLHKWDWGSTVWQDLPITWWLTCHGTANYNVMHFCMWSWGWLILYRMLKDSRPLHGCWVHVTSPASQQRGMPLVDYGGRGPQPTVGREDGANESCSILRILCSYSWHFSCSCLRKTELRGVFQFDAVRGLKILTSKL